MPDDTAKMLGQLAGGVAQLEVKIDRTQDSIDGLREDVGEVKEHMAALRTRQEDHTGRIHLVEERIAKVGGKQALMRGIYLGVAGLLGLVGGGLALVKALME